MKKINWKEKLKKLVWFVGNPRFLLCFGLAWIITNGWSYIMMGLGTWLKIEWMIAVSGAYLTFLWLPVSPEKLLTFVIAIWLLRRLFPNDTKTLAVMRDLYHGAQSQWRKFREKRNWKRAERKQKKEERKANKDGVK